MSKVYVVSKDQRKASPRTLLPGGTQVQQIKGSVYTAALQSAGRVLVHKDSSSKIVGKAAKIRAKAG